MNNEAFKKIGEAMRLLEEARDGVMAVPGFTLVWDVKIEYCPDSRAVYEAVKRGMDKIASDDAEPL